MQPYGIRSASILFLITFFQDEPQAVAFGIVAAPGFVTDGPAWLPPAFPVRGAVQRVSGLLGTLAFAMIWVFHCQLARLRLAFGGCG
jgi:hypothetical protein